MKTNAKGVHRGARLGIALIAAGVLAAACSSGNENTMSDSAAGSVGMTAAASPSYGASAAAQPASPSSFNDAQILGKVQGADSGEVALAKLAEQKATNSGVKSFARMLVTDHSKSASQVKQIAKDSLTAQTPPGDTTATATAHLVDRFQSMPKGMQFDTAFVNHEVEDHQHDIDDTKQMVDAAKDPQVKQLLQKSLPVLQKHLDRAKQLQKQLEKSAS